MEMELYTDGEENRGKWSLLKACGTILWALMIAISVFLASRSLML